MAKNKLKIDTDVRIKVGYRTMDPVVVVKAIEEEALGTIIDINAFDDEKYYVVFEDYLTDEGVTLSLWLKADELEIV